MSNEPGDRKLCFVIMGFGKKTDYSGKKARTLNLDATYEAIIKPAVVACGYRCIRADEEQRSGVIDQRMYELLLRADLVIADISTANPNALYELGVRHALRPRTTIVMREQDGLFPFDLNHVATLHYRHLGEDIGFTEATTKKSALEALIRSVSATKDTDSPVFTFLAALGLKSMSEEDLARIAREAQEVGETLAEALDVGKKAAAASDHVAARRAFERALQLHSRPAPGGQTAAAPDPFIVQQLALATYKAKKPSVVEALREAWTRIAVLGPETSTDPETLGIAGAIQKRLWEAEKESKQLDAAIELYGRGFEVKRDYYNGENYAVCLDLRAGARAATAPDEALYDRMTARKVRARVEELLVEAFKDPAVTERSDYKWMLATMANTLIALRRDAEAEAYERQFRALAVGWEIETFEGGQVYARAIAALPG